jgi:hypothetical protein
MLKGSKISRYRILKVIDCYCLDLVASKTAVLLKLNRNTVNRYYAIFRRLVAAHQAKEFKLLAGVVEVDECYFRPNRLKGRIGPRRKGRATCLGIPRQFLYCRYSYPVGVMPARSIGRDSRNATIRTAAANLGLLAP